MSTDIQEQPKQVVISEPLHAKLKILAAHERKNLRDAAELLIPLVDALIEKHTGNGKRK